MQKAILLAILSVLICSGCATSPHFTVPQKVTVFYTDQDSSRCYNYAVAELVRLLKRIDVAAETVKVPSESDLLYVQLSVPGTVPRTAAPLPQDLMQDAYRLTVTNTAVTISSASAKGILNGVYDLAERLGYLFLLPGNDGEWAPPKDQVHPLPTGDSIANPRFPFRGVFWEGLDTTNDYTDEEWLRFYAKLRFNALRHNIEDLPLTEQLGLRLEVGGHGLSKLLPRNNFDEHPEWFRMVQPYDFGGQRVNDFNFCVTNQQAREVVKENFRKKLKELQGVHAIHAWADDLPGGGWCFCPTCRAFAPSDQAMLAMNCLTEVVAEENLPIRIPVLAYHDTMFPSTNIAPSKQCCLLFAPRERCYGHALDDPTCRRNQFYLKALEQWTEKFKGIDDAHTFEYYFDQILFRGLYPFLPGIIIDDMRVYQEHGIQCHLSLQVAGPAIAPEHNMLIFAKALWDEGLTKDAYIKSLANRLCPDQPQPWRSFLIRRAQIFTDAMRMCEHDLEIYLDYRWLAETTLPFGREMAEAYERAANGLAEIADELADAVEPTWPKRLQTLAEKEIRRARFEAAEFHVMHLQQRAMNHFADFLNTRNRKDVEQGVYLLEQTIRAQKPAYEKAKQAQLPESSWYYKSINQWLQQEFQQKIANYRSEIEN